MKKKTLKLKMQKMKKKIQEGVPLFPSSFSFSSLTDIAASPSTSFKRSTWVSAVSAASFLMWICHSTGVEIGSKTIEEINCH